MTRASRAAGGRRRAATPARDRHGTTDTRSRAMTPAEIIRARRILMRRDPRLAGVIKRAGPCHIGETRTREAFASLVRAILSQQLSTKAAATIHGRVAALAATHGDGSLSPQALLATDAAALRAAGVSWPKISYLRDLAERVLDGRLPLGDLETCDDDKVIEEITAVKGLGRWSAEMFLMFRLNRPDIFPVDDLGIVKGMQKIFGMKSRPKPRTMLRLAEPWRPYRTIAAWYVWRSLED